MLEFVNEEVSGNDGAEEVEEDSSKEKEEVRNEAKTLVVRSDLIRQPLRIVHSRGDGLAWRVWPGAKLLLRYIVEKKPNCLFRTLPDGRTIPRARRAQVIELGSGVGTVGLFCAAMGIRSTITDTEESVPALNRSLVANSFLTKCGGSDAEEEGENLAMAMALDWGKQTDATRAIRALSSRSVGLKKLVVLLSDCTYWDCLYVPLASTLRHLLLAARECGGKGTVLCAHERRQWKTEKRFFTKRLRQHGLTATAVYEGLREGEETNPLHELSGWNQRVYRIELADGEV